MIDLINRIVNLEDNVEDIRVDVDDLNKLKDHMLKMDEIDRKVAAFRSQLINEYCDSLSK